MIDTFSRAQFEAVLPIHKLTGAPLWRPLGLRGDHYCYLLPVTEHAGVLINSSVWADGMSAGTGQDSIKLYIVRNHDLRICASKLQSYTTRTRGWENRMLDQLHQMWPMARQTGPCPMPGCNGWVGLFKCREGENKGRYFHKCDRNLDKRERARQKSAIACAYYKWLTPATPAIVCPVAMPRTAGEL